MTYGAFGPVVIPAEFSTAFQCNINETRNSLELTKQFIIIYALFIKKTIAQLWQHSNNYQFYLMKYLNTIIRNQTSMDVWTISNNLHFPRNQTFLTK